MEILRNDLNHYIINDNRGDTIYLSIDEIEELYETVMNKEIVMEDVNLFHFLECVVAYDPEITINGIDFLIGEFSFTNNVRKYNQWDNVVLTCGRVEGQVVLYEKESGQKYNGRLYKIQDGTVNMQLVREE